MPINTWRGPCRYCGKKVGARKGFAAKSPATGSWLVWHGKCEPKAADLQAAPTARMPYADD